MNEGFLGRHTLSGERAATDDHPVILHALPLADTVTAKLAVGTLLKRVDVEDDDDAVIDVAYAPFLSTDAATVMPCAVVDKPCDPTGDYAETSALCVVHGTVKTRVLVTGDSKAPSQMVLGRLMQSGIFSV
ncbi:MAG: hypothetical protein R3Y11_07010 [Pseudomonadota bacterium]